MTSRAVPFDVAKQRKATKPNPTTKTNAKSATKPKPAPKSAAKPKPAAKSKPAAKPAKPSATKPPTAKPSSKATRAAATAKSTAVAKPAKAKPPLKIKIPEYSDPIHGNAGELLMSTPAWYDKYEAKITTVRVDARVWPPKVVSRAARTSAAARMPDGRWACVSRHEGSWAILWFDSITAAKPSRVEPVPFEAPPPVADPDSDDPPQDPGPIARLHAFANTLLAIPFSGPVHVREGDGAWREHALMRGTLYDVARSVTIDGVEHIEWGGALYDADLRLADALACKHYISAGERVFAIHGEQLVERDANATLIGHLPGHYVTGIERGPSDTLILALQRDDERGTETERAIYDPCAATVTVLPKGLVGDAPHIVTCTLAGDLVLHRDREHQLECVTAAQLAALPTIAAADFPAPPRIELAALDDVGAASRPLVATTGTAIVIALGHDLRIHDLDAPKAVVRHGQPLVGVAARDRELAALDATGVLHTYALDGKHLASRPTVPSPRTLAAGRDAWLVAGVDRVLRIDATQTAPPRTIEIAGAVAVAADPDTDELLIAAEDRRLASWSNGELRDLPPTIEQLVAAAPLGDRKFVCAGVRDLYLLDLVMPELVALDVRGRRPCLAATGAGRLGTCSSAGAVQAYDLAGTAISAVEKGSVYYSSYSSGDGRDITVNGLAFMDDGRLVILLDDGRANIVNPDTGQALKLDPQPGDAPSSWVFITGAGILMAD